MASLLTYTSLDYPSGPVPQAPPAAPSVPAGLADRLRESFGFPWTWGMPQQWRSLQDFAFGGSGFYPNQSTGTVNDRRYGRDLPLYWTEIDLRSFRVLSRYLADTNDFAIGFLGLLKGYNVRKGFGWQACLKGARKTPYPTTSDDTDPLVAKGQRVLDTFRDNNLWPVTSREAFLRWRRDGEVFGRLFRGGWQRVPAFRFVEPEQVGAPDGQLDCPWAFGIEVRELPDGSLDPGEVLAYHVWNQEDGLTGEWVDGEDVVHAKANVDQCVRRGLPDLFPLQDQLDGVRKLLRNMLYTAVDQAAVAWREKFPTSAASEVRAMVPFQTTSPGQTMSTAGSSPYGWGDPSFFPFPGPGIPGTGNKFRPGTVVRTEGNREFEEGPTAGGVPNYIQVVQAALRGCCVRWNLPEYATGDASNNNFASSLVSGSPFTVTVEGSQLEWGACFERPVALRVLDRAVEAGLLTRDERARLDVEVTEPAVVTPEPEKDTQRRIQLIQAGVLSKTTAMQQEGLDPQHETENIKSEQPQQPAAPGVTGVTPDGNSDTGGLGGLLGESVVSEAGREGLVAKKVTRTSKTGKQYQTTVYVRSQPKEKPAAKADPAAVKAEVLKHLGDPGSLTPEKVQDLTAKLKTLTVAQIQEIQKSRGVKGGATKDARVQKILDHARAKPAGKPKAEEPAGPAAAVDRPGLYRDLVAEVERVGRTGRGARFDELFAAAKKLHPGVTPDEFRAAVRKLDADGHIALSGWNDQASSIPDPLLTHWHAGGDSPRDAGDKPFYFANPAAWHGVSPKTASPEASAPGGPAAGGASHAAVRAALDSFGIAHAHLSDEDVAARLKAAFGGGGGKPAAGGKK